MSRNTPVWMNTAVWIDSFESIKPDLFRFLHKVEAEDGLISNAREWCNEGWGLEDEPQPEQLAAALFMEAADQDVCVERGESDASYPIRLRTVAHRILALSGHGDPRIKDLCDRHIKLSNRYENCGNVGGSVQLRAVGNMLGTLYMGNIEPTTVLPEIGNNAMKRVLIDATYIRLMDGNKDVRCPCKYDAANKFVTEIQNPAGDERPNYEAVELPDGTRLTEDDGVIYDY